MVGTQQSVRRPRLRTLAVLVAFSSASFAFVGASPAKADITGYVALGDSFSSGEGTFNYDAGTDVKKNECHRQSTLAYPAKVRDAMGFVPFVFAACSGAKAKDLIKGRAKSGGHEGAQVNQIAAKGEFNPMISLVTLTIGGNDAGFAKILKKCVFFKEIKDQETKCSKAGDGWVKDGMKDIVKVVPQILDEVHKRAPNARIRQLLYPMFINPNVANNCFVFGASAFITPKVVGFLQNWLNQVNGSIGTAINTWLFFNPDADAATIDTSTAFAGNEICSANPTDVNAVLVGDGGVKVESFHPTAAGNVKLANKVIAALGG